MKTAEAINDLYNERRDSRAGYLEAMREIRDTYNGDIVIPLPEVDEKEKPAVANLVAEGIDQQAMRIASTMPDVRCPPMREGIKAEKERARTRRYAYLSFWEDNRMGRKLRRRARHLPAYGSSPVYLRPNFATKMPVWEVESPLTSYPAPMSDPDDLTPTDCIFAFTRNFAYLRTKFPEAMNKVLSSQHVPHDDSELWDLLRYVDAEEIVLVALRTHQERIGTNSALTQDSTIVAELSRIPNRAGMCTAVVPGRVTLDRIQGAFNQLLGMYVTQAQLMALDMIAVSKAIFPDMVLIGNQGETPRLISGNWKDGRTGEINVVAGGTVTAINAQPGFQTQPTIDRLERNQRIMGGIPAQFGGEMPSNVRTGRAGALTLSASVDFRIQEYQETLALSLEEENKRAAAIMRGYFGQTKKTFVMSTGDRVVKDDYVPEEVFDTLMNSVFYAMPGADANNLVVGIGQRLGIELMSKRTGRALDPFIPDYEREEELVNQERIERAAFAAFEQQALQGAVPLIDVARIWELVQDEGMSMMQALVKAQRESQERQAQQAPPSAPEAQPGLSLPEMGAEAAPAIEPPAPSLDNLTNLLQNLRTGG